MKLMEIYGNEDNRVGVFVCSDCQLFEEVLFNNQEKMKSSPLKRMMNERRK